MVPAAGQVRHTVRGWGMNHSTRSARELQNSKTRVGTALSDRALNALNENEQRLFRTRTEIGANKSKILQKMLWVHEAPESNCKGKS